MHLAFDIFQGLGIAAAAGIRPFLPTLLVGALADGDIQIDFKGTDYSFLQAWPFLVAMLVAAMVVGLLERRAGDAAEERRLADLGLVAAGLALGALLFAGALAQDRNTSWPGLIGGVACAAIGAAAIRPLVARVRARLSGGDAAALPVYVEVIALVVALLSVLLPPVGVVAIAALGWLLLASRRRQGRKYAGLRILR